MSRPRLIAFGVVVLIAAAGYMAYRAIDDEGGEPSSGDAPEALTAAEIATCREAGLPSPPESWRRQAAVAGSFGLSGPARDFRDRLVVGELPNGELVTKLPAIVEGDAPATVRVPDRYRGRVGLGFGNLGTPDPIADARTIVRFEPCARRPRTGWPGGLVIADRRPIELEVEIAGEGGVRILGVGRS